MDIQQNSTIVFQGDSITDSGRNYKNFGSLGNGYVLMVRNWFSARYPERNVKFINKGVSGSKIKNLRTRWQKDFIDVRPDVVSILIGINDALSKYFWKHPTSIEDFESDYRRILESIHEAFNAEIVIMEPFVLANAKNYIELRNDLNPIIETVRKLSGEYRTSLVSLDTIFEEAVKKKAAPFWSEDGIHPTLVGHALIAQSLLQLLEEL